MVPDLCADLLTEADGIFLLSPFDTWQKRKTPMRETDDHTTTLAAIKSQLSQFVRERDWEQYHFPKDLAIGLSTEAAELLEHFRFRSNDEIARQLQDEEFLRKVGHELADVLYFVLLMCNKLGLDATRNLREKLALSAARYPIDLARGKNLKYTELHDQKGKRE